MEVSLLSILGIGFILGIKHAIEPDHIIAVSTIASHSKKLWRSSLAGLFWGIGHTATLFMVGLALMMMRDTIPEKWALSLEFLVGIMLVYLGLSNIGFIRKRAVLYEHGEGQEAHKHFISYEHLPAKDRSYVKSLLIGMVHGLAGSAAMALLTISAVDTVWQGVEFILFFGAGTIFGMLFFTTAIGIPFVLSSRNLSMNAGLTRLTGAISAVFGLYYMYNLGVSERLFQLWLQ